MHSVIRFGFTHFNFVRVAFEILHLYLEENDLKNNVGVMTFGKS